jgi:hypothetical protein
MFPKKTLKLLNVDPEKSWQKGIPLLNPNGASDEIGESMDCTKTAKNLLIKYYDGGKEGL